MSSTASCHCGRPNERRARPGERTVRSGPARSATGPVLPGGQGDARAPARADLRVRAVRTGPVQRPPSNRRPMIGCAFRGAPSLRIPDSPVALVSAEARGRDVDESILAPRSPSGRRASPVGDAENHLPFSACQGPATDDPSEAQRARCIVRRFSMSATSARC